MVNEMSVQFILRKIHGTTNQTKPFRIFAVTEREKYRRDLNYC